MTQTVRTKMHEQGWGDSLGVSEMQKMLSLMGDISVQEMRNLVKSGFLYEIVHSRPVGGIGMQMGSYMTCETSMKTTTQKCVQMILWDSDGVLVDSERVFFQLTQKVFKNHGVDLDLKTWAQDFLGHGLHTYEIAMKLGMPQEDAKRMATHRDILWGQRLRSPIDLVPGARYVIEELRKENRMAVVTGAPRKHFEDIHQHTGLLPFFETTITMDECPHVKPRPDAYVMAAEQLRVHPSQCLVVEDSPRGVRAALDAGMRCVLIRSDLTVMNLCDSDALVVDSIEDLPAILEILNRA